MLNVCYYDHSMSVVHTDLFIQILKVHILLNKNLVYFNWISTTSFITLNNRGVKNVFQLHYWQYKIDTALVYKKSFVFQLGRISHSEKKKCRLH